MSDTANSNGIVLASADANGAEGNDASMYQSVSRDGRYVTFVSWASNLVPSDNNNFNDVFVKDLQTGLITSVSTDSVGNPPNSYSYISSISADGRFVAFDSNASNLVSNDTNNVGDVFIRDLQTGTTTKISTDATGNQGDGTSYFPTISADGRYVAFYSYASNLVPDDTNRFADVFVRDLQTGAISRVGTNAYGQYGAPEDIAPSISADGRYVAYVTAFESAPGDDHMDVFVHDLHSGDTIRVPTDSAEGSNDSFAPSISADGRYVAFASTASDLVPGDTNGTADVFVRDLQTGTTIRVSTDENGNQATGPSNSPSISADGRYVAFIGRSTSGKGSDVFVRDLQTGAIRRVSIAAGGNPASDSSFGAKISGDGRYVTFFSYASNLVSADTNHERDVFVAPNPLRTDLIPPNIAPTIDTSAGATAAIEGAPVTVDNGLTVADPDSFTLASATVSITSGFHSGEDVLTFNSGSATGNIQGNYNSTAGVLGLASAPGTATLAQWQTALRAITYKNISDTPNTADRIVSFMVNDGASASMAASKGVSLTALDNAPYEYTTLDVPSATGGVASPSPNNDVWASGVNYSGQIVGSVNGIGFLYSNGSDSVLHDPPGIGYVPTSINSNGQIVGHYSSGGQLHGFLYSDGTYTTVDDPLGSNSTVPYALNASGKIVGYYRDSNSRDHGFLLDAGKFSTLDDPLGTNGTIAAGINDQGEIVGYYYDGTGAHAFLYSNGNYASFDYPVSAAQTFATGINTDGQIVGYYLEGSVFHGFLFDGATFRALDDPLAESGTISEGIDRNGTQLAGINDNGEIVGSYFDGMGHSHAFVATVASLTTSDNPDGSHTARNWDRYKQNAWSNYTITYDSEWRPQSQTTNYHDGTGTIQNWDVLNQNAWSDYVWSYDAQGRTSSQAVDYHDGTHSAQYWDVENQNTWSDWVGYYDNQNQETAHFVDNRDGTHTAQYFDVHNQNTWSDWAGYYDTQNRETVHFVGNRDGTRTAQYFDVQDRNTWANWAGYYDIQNRETAHFVNNDDGTRTAQYFDVLNQNPWTDYVYAFDSGDRLTSQTIDYRDGHHTVQMYDVAGTQKWSSVLTSYDANWQQQLQTFLYRAPPVVLDLDGNGIDISPLSASTASFDMNGGGERLPTAWVGRHDGLLAIDLGAEGQAGPDGVVDQAKEISFSLWAPGTTSDLQALRQVFDTDHDGRLDPGDARWNEFRVWTDANSDGLSEAGEGKTLSELGITSIELQPSSTSTTYSDGSSIQGLSEFTRSDGSQDLVGHVALTYAMSDTGSGSKLELLRNYMASSFISTSSDPGGMSLTDVSQTATQNPVVCQPHV